MFSLYSMQLYPIQQGGSMQVVIGVCAVIAVALLIYYLVVLLRGDE